MFIKGWKTLVGSLAKGAAGSAIGYVVAHAPDIPLDPNSKLGAGVAIALLFLGDALQKIGLGSKLDKNTAAAKMTEGEKVVEARVEAAAEKMH